MRDIKLRSGGSSRDSWWLPLVLSMLLLLFLGCGREAVSIKPSADGSPAIPQGSPRPATGPVKQLQPTKISLPRDNRNDRSSALGRLCWTGYELWSGLRSLRLTLESRAPAPKPDEDEAERVVARLRATVTNIGKSLGSDRGLPQEARPFREEFERAAKNAAETFTRYSNRLTEAERRALHEEIMDQLGSFSTWATVHGYEEAIKADPKSCPTPI